MRRIRRQDRLRPQEPQRCSCTHHSDTAEWQSKRGSGAGLTTRRGAKHDGTCIHSELRRTTAARPEGETVERIILR